MYFNSQLYSSSKSLCRSTHICILLFWLDMFPIHCFQVAPCYGKVFFYFYSCRNDPLVRWEHWYCPSICVLYYKSDRYQFSLKIFLPIIALYQPSIDILNKWNKPWNSQWLVNCGNLQSFTITRLDVENCSPMVSQQVFFFDYTMPFSSATFSLSRDCDVQVSSKQI